MSKTLNSIKVDFGLGAPPPRVTFQQGANMDVTNIRLTLRQIEESMEGLIANGAVSSQNDGRGWIARSGGLLAGFAGGAKSALTLKVMPPYDVLFLPGATPFATSGGNFLATFVDSPGAIVQINNADGALLVDNVAGVADAVLDAEDYTLLDKPGFHPTFTGRIISARKRWFRTQALLDAATVDAAELEGAYKSRTVTGTHTTKDEWASLEDRAD